MNVGITLVVRCGRHEKEMQEEEDKGTKGIKERKKEGEGLRYERSITRSIW
jgi:hypothetical protein